MHKIIVGLVAASIVAAPIALAATANADKPPVDGSYTENTNSNVDRVEDGGHNQIAAGSSGIIQNGQFVSGRVAGASGWQNQAGTRADQVQKDLALSGLGRN